MHGKEGGHHGTGPKASGHLPKNQEQHDRRGGLQQHVHKVVGPGVHAEELAIQQVRHPRHRVPVCHVLVREDPGDSPRGQATGDFGIVIDITAVVKIDKPETGGLGEHQPNRCQQQTANGQPWAAAAFARLRGRGDIDWVPRPWLDGVLIVHRENHLMLAGRNPSIILAYAGCVGKLPTATGR